MMPSKQVWRWSPTQLATSTEPWEIADRVAAEFPDYPRHHFSMICWRNDRFDEVIDEARRVQPWSPEFAEIMIAITRALQGNPEQAQALAARLEDPASEPDQDPLRDEPRFRTLLERLNLPSAPSALQ